MATNKKLLGVRVSLDLLDDLKRLHMKEARVRYRSKRRLTFSSWVEEVLGDYVRVTDDVRKEEANPSTEWPEFDD